MATFAKPENALKRAEELMNVGQKQAALQALHDLITNKRNRTWQKTLEKIMMKYIDLCVDMRKGRFAKDGLIQYRIICQQVNVGSLEEVIKYFMKLSTEKAEEAQAQAAAEVTDLDVKDLEEDSTPEDLMLSFVSGEKGKERADKELVTPWFKFLWETYRTVLEILKNNSKLEPLYAMTAHKAFQFCLQYKRPTEFRRLCDILRNHLVNLNKYKDQRDKPDLNQPETLQLFLDTRFEQLKSATELEMWQEAFRSVEDIHGLMTLVKKTPKPQMMAVYYAKLTQIFWVSDNLLYHAYACYRLYSLQRNYNKNLKEKDLQLMASSVVLAAMAVPPFERRHGGGQYELEIERDRNVRMATLLGFVTDPKKDVGEVLSRSSLLSELVAKGVLAYVPPEVKALFSLLETEFHPLDLAQRASSLLETLSSYSDSLSPAAPIGEIKLEQYVPSLQKVATWKLLLQVSQVYQTMKLKNLTKAIPFLDLPSLEKAIVEAVRFGYVRLKLNYQKGTLHFGGHELESEGIRSQLVVLAKRLTSAVSLIGPAGRKEDRPRLVASVQALQAAVEAEHQKMSARKVVIERRKEDTEREIIEKEKEEKTEKLRLQRLTEEAEAKRLQHEQARRLEERIRRELEEKELAEAKALLEERRKKEGKKKGAKKGPEIEGKLDKRSLLQAALEEQMKEKQESERKLLKTTKLLDHLERARREEERSLIQDAFQQKTVSDRKFHQDQQAALLEQTAQQHSKDMEEKKRLLRMLEEKESFEEHVLARRKGEIEVLRQEREERLAEIRAIKHAQCLELRKKEFYKRTEEAKVRRQLEDELSRKREEIERKKAEEAERLRKLDEIAAKQRQREAEAEEKLRLEKAQILNQTPSKPGGKFLSAAFRRASENAPPGREPDRWTRSETSDALPSRDGDRWTSVSRDRGPSARPTPTPVSRQVEPSTSSKFVPSALSGRGGAGEAPVDPPRGAGRADDGKWVSGRSAAPEDRPRPSASSGKWVPRHRQ